MRRVAPAIGLFFVAPLVAEYLLGDIPIKLLGVIAILAPLYGGGALLIREVTRRTGRGWPTIFVLAFAYAVLEEAFTTQTLFNPNYLNLNLHLLQPAYIPALGIGVWWTVFVLTLHTVWSISVSIALVEALVPDRATTPWLRGPGLTVTSVLFILAVIATTSQQIKQSHFMATRAQFATSAGVCIAAIAVAFLMPRPSSVRAGRPVPSPWIMGGGALLAGSIFLVVPNAWAWLAVAIYMMLDVIAIVCISAFSRREGWNARHRLALAGGAALAYGWHAFIQTPAVGSGSMASVRSGNVIFAAALIVLLLVAERRTAHSAASRPAQ